MRRREREVTAEAEILSILDKADVCRLAFCAGDKEPPYIVPLSYGYEYAKGKLRLVFHCAAEGRKLSLMQLYPRVGFELDCDYLLHAAQTACQYSCRYASIIGKGTAHMVEDEPERRRAIDLLLRHVAGCTPPIDDDALAHTAVFEVIAGELSAKRHA